jgi:hypothetical protein
LQAAAAVANSLVLAAVELAVFYILHRRLYHPLCIRQQLVAVEPHLMEVEAILSLAR